MNSAKPNQLARKTDIPSRQMELFFLDDPQDAPFSHSIELWDAVPKWYWARPQRMEGKYLPILTREFKHKEKFYTVNISPARIKKIEKGKTVEKEFYPGLREELIEEALRKMACSGGGTMLTDEDGNEQAGVIFSLRSLQTELADMGHNFNIAQIKEGIIVNAKTLIELKSKDGNDILLAPIFTTVGLTTREEWVKQAGDAKAFIRFNPLVTKSIKDRSFRQYNYVISMQYNYSLARWLHKRMSHNYRQASTLSPYHILMSTITRDTGTATYGKITHKIRDIKLALDELKEKGVIVAYSDETIYDTKRSNKISDVKFIIIPSPDFVSEMKRFNKKYQILQEATI